MIKGSVTLVTGGASGLGRATVECLVQQGGIAVISDLPTSNGQEYATKLGVDKCTFVPTIESDVQNLINVIRNKYGKLDNIVNCAGIFLVNKTFDFRTKTPHDLKAFSQVLNVNTIGTFNVIRLAVELIGENKPNKDGQRGVIINTASVAAFEGQVGGAAYSASKGAIVAMTLVLAREFASRGIRVCAIAPGLFDTPMADSVSDAAKSSLLRSVVFPRRFGNPLEFALLVKSIIENTMLNGEVIRLDAGLRLEATVQVPSGKL